MGTFDASLRAIGDTRPLPATVEIADGRMSIAAGSTHIGDWELDDIELQEMPTGYRVAAEGEQILVELKDLDGFAEALARNARKTRFRRKVVRPSDDGKMTAEVAAPARPEPDRPEPASALVTDPKESKRHMRFGSRGSKPEPTATSTETERPVRGQVAVDEDSNRFVATVDRMIGEAEKRWGPLLPPWVFTRGMLLAVTILLVLTIFFPGTASAVLIVLGFALIMFGGVAYSDEIVAAKWLPGRSNPAHPLIAGVAVLILGVLVGVLAR